jgi:hypothetical protein
MELTIADSVNPTPTAADITAALRATPFPDDWCLTLDDGNDVMLDAEYDPVGAFRVSVWDKGTRLHAATDVGAATVLAMLQKFLAGDTSWRDLSQWESAEEAKAKGLVNRVAAPEAIDAEVESLVASIIAKPRVALAMGKQLFYRQLEVGVEAAYEDAGRTMACNMMDEAALEGVQAFIDKRKPSWAS